MANRKSKLAQKKRDEAVIQSPEYRRAALYRLIAINLEQYKGRLEINERFKHKLSPEKYQQIIEQTHDDWDDFTSGIRDHGGNDVLAEVIKEHGNLPD